MNSVAGWIFGLAALGGTECPDMPWRQTEQVYMCAFAEKMTQDSSVSDRENSWGPVATERPCARTVYPPLFRLPPAHYHLAKLVAGWKHNGRRNRSHNRKTCCRGPDDRGLTGQHRGPIAQTSHPNRTIAKRSLLPLSLRVRTHKTSTTEKSFDRCARKGRHAPLDDRRKENCSL